MAGPFWLLLSVEWGNELAGMAPTNHEPARVLLTPTQLDKLSRFGGTAPQKEVCKYGGPSYFMQIRLSGGLKDLLF